MSEIKVALVTLPIEGNTYKLMLNADEVKEFVTLSRDEQADFIMNHENKEFHSSVVTFLSESTPTTVDVSEERDFYLITLAEVYGDFNTESKVLLSVSKDQDVEDVTKRLLINFSRATELTGEDSAESSDGVYSVSIKGFPRKLKIHEAQVMKSFITPISFS